MSCTIEAPRSTVVGRILVVDDHAQARASIADVLREAGHTVECSASGAAGLRKLQHESFDLLITDLQMPGLSGVDVIREVERLQLGVQSIIITAHASVSTAVEAMRHGAFDYIEKPFNVDQLELLVERGLRHGQALDRRSVVGHATPSACPTMIGTSPAMQTLRERIAQVAPTPETVLIIGESGTGKELVARTIHAASDRAAAPMISLNCPVLSAQLMESELFGHERGAFTGADKDRTGRFELADGGTLLLDEVTEIEPPLQAKLLRVLQERCFERVGSSNTIHVDVRLIATTNRELSEEVSEGRFREDLYYRLAVVPMVVPSLRKRREDIPELVDHFRQRAAQRLGKSPIELTEAARELLAGYDWPGNVRELENIVTRASVLGGEQAVDADQIRPWLLHGESPAAEEAELPVGLSLQEMERKLIESTLQHFDGHRAKTAEALGIGIRTLSGKLRSYGYAPRTKEFATG